MIWTWDNNVLRFDATCWTFDGGVTCPGFMAHYREQIRKAVITAVTGLTTTSTRVESGPVYNLADDMSPTLAVWTRRSTPDYETGQLQCAPLWVAEVVIEGYVKAFTDLLDTLDDIASEVETAIYADSALAALCNGYMELGEQNIEMDLEGDKPLGKIEMIFNVYYHAAEGAPDSKV